jgi:hypothetical protein
LARIVDSELDVAGNAGVSAYRMPEGLEPFANGNHVNVERNVRNRNIYSNDI